MPGHWTPHHDAPTALAPPDMQRHLPNCLTLLRLVLAVVFFIALNRYRYPVGPSLAAWGAVALFVLAAITDVLDGHLARRWQVETTFGRIMDPFCDKVLVLGAFIYLAGPRFVHAAAAAPAQAATMASGVYPWMVVVMLSRELLVTSIRGMSEREGRQFAARLSGKLKALLQMVVVPVLIGIVALDPNRPGHGWMIPVRDVSVHATVAVTVVSGLSYVRSAWTALRTR